MPMWWPLRAMTRLWEWAIPGLISLEPAAMALLEASGQTGFSPRASAEFPAGLVRAVPDQLPSQSLRIHVRVEGAGK